MKNPAHGPGFFLDLVFFDFFFAGRCWGGAFATTPAARSKRSHASGWSSMSLDAGDFDMPQPINKILPKPHVLLDTEILNDKPELALLVVRIFALWASIERRLSVLLVHLLGADSTHAHAIFSILQTQALQTKAMEAAAKSALEGDDLDVFSAYMTVISSVQKTRNRLAHWSWAKCTERSDLLVLGDPDGIKERDMRLAAHLQSLRPGASLLEMAHNIQFDLSKFYGYSKADLEREVRDLAEADIIGFIFQNNYLDPSFSVLHAGYFDEPDDPAVIRGRALQQLNEKRLFREALARIRANRKSTRPPPRESSSPGSDESS
jgi:hypothetical protein